MTSLSYLRPNHLSPFKIESIDSCLFLVWSVSSILILNLPPFKGAYEDQSFKWASKVNIMETAMAKREEREYKKAQAKANVGDQNG